MSNDTQVLDRNPVSHPVFGNQVQPQMGSLNKEAPIATGLPELKPAGPEAKHDIDQQLKDLGVEEKKDSPDLTFEHKQIGLEHSGATVPVPPGPTGLVQISQKEDISSSGTWLDTLREKVRKVMKLIGL